MITVYHRYPWTLGPNKGELQPVARIDVDVLSQAWKLTQHSDSQLWQSRPEVQFLGKPDDYPRSSMDGDVLELTEELDGETTTQRFRVTPFGFEKVSPFEVDGGASPVSSYVPNERWS